MIILRPLLRLLISHEWQGKENFPGTGGVILAPNHLSYADWPTIALFSDACGHRYPVFMIKSAVFEVKLLGPLLYKLGQLPVYRGRSDAGLVLRQAEQALRGGACVIVYPEGTATRDPDLWPMAGHSGVARLALTTGAPVIPIAHWGAHDILPLRQQAAPPVPAQDCADGRRAAGGPVQVRGPAAGREHAAGCHRRHHDRHHRAAGRAEEAAAACCTLRPRRSGRDSSGPDESWHPGDIRCDSSGGSRAWGSAAARGAR